MKMKGKGGVTAKGVVLPKGSTAGATSKVNNQLGTLKKRTRDKF